MNIRAEKTLIATVLFVVTTTVFFAAGVLTSSRGPTPWLETRWDAAVPLVPFAIWPYLSWYIAPLPVLTASRQDFRRVACAIAFAFAICSLAYLLFPASIQRPHVDGNTLSQRVLLFVYKYDPPCNIFPSFHAALCAILWRPPFGGWITRKMISLWMVTICAACVLTKQHNLLDIVAGILVGFSALMIATALLSRAQREHAENVTSIFRRIRSLGL